MIRLYRLAAGLTQPELGALAGYSVSAISRIEHGGGSLHEIDTRRRLAGVLRIPGAMLGLAAQQWELDRTEEPVDRRDLLRGVTAVGAAMPLARIADVRRNADQALHYSGHANRSRSTYALPSAYSSARSCRTCLAT